MSLLRHASKISITTLLSRITGFMRDSIFAMSFGTNEELDIFLLAFKVPNFLRRIFAEGACGQAFIPVLAEYNQDDLSSKQLNFLNALFTLLTMTVVVFAIIIWCFPSMLVKIYAAGYTPGSERYELALKLLRYTFPYIICIAWAAFFGAALQAKRQFLHAAINPVILNVVLIVAALSISWGYIDKLWLAWAVPVAGLLQVLILLYVYQKHYSLPKFRMHAQEQGVSKVVNLVAMGSYSYGLGQLGGIIDNNILSYLPAGSISWMYLTERLCYLPLGVFGVSIITVLGPALADSYIAKDQSRFTRQLDWAILAAGILGIPSAIGLLLFCEPIIMTLFHHGKFTHHDVVMTAQSLRVLALGIPGFMWAKVLASAFYTRQDTKTPAWCATIGLLANVVLALVLMKPLGHCCTALAVVVQYYLQIIILQVYLAKHNIYRVSNKIYTTLAKICLASIAMLVTTLIQPPIAVWLAMSTLSKLGVLTAIMALATTAYTMVLYSFSLNLSTLARQD